MRSIIAIAIALTLCAVTLAATTDSAFANKKGSHYRCVSGC